MYPNTLDSLCKSKRVPTVEKQSTEQKLFLISFNFFLSCTRTAKKTNKMNVKKLFAKEGFHGNGSLGNVVISRLSLTQCQSLNQTLKTLALLLNYKPIDQDPQHKMNIHFHLF